MRGTVAKRIRREVYGDNSHSVRKYRRDDNHCRSDFGLRADYQKAKKEYYAKKNI